jgi:hypothetical protein
MRLKMTSLAAALLATLATSGQASVLPYKSFDALLAESDGIVVGTVRSVEATASAPHDVHTYVTLDQLEMLSGRVDAPTLTLRLKGGLAGRSGLHVDGAPHFAPEERVLLFVQGNGRDLVPFVGWSQGVFRLATDAATGRQQVRDADGNLVLGVAGGQVLREAGAQLETEVVGAPEAVQLGRQAKPEASGGVAEDGSPVEQLGVQAGPVRPIAADRFLAQVRQRAGEGKLLSSVGPQDVAPADGPAADATGSSSRAARHLVAMPQGDSVAPPLPRPAAAPADAR